MQATYIYAGHFIPDRPLLRVYARLPCCRLKVEAGIKAARDRKCSLSSESSVANFLRRELRGRFKNLDLNDATRRITGRQRVYVTMPHLVNQMNGKVGIAALQDTLMTRFMFSEGDGAGSLFDLVHQTRSPATEFPSTTRGVWDPPSYTHDDSGMTTRSAGSD